MRWQAAVAIVLVFFLAGCMDVASSTKENQQAKTKTGQRSISETTATAEAVLRELPKAAHWEALPDGALTRAEHCAALVGHKFYVTGGLIVPTPISLPGGAPTAVPTARTEVFDAEARSWSAGPDFPANIDHCMGVSLGEYGYILHNSGSYKIKDGGSWESIPQMPHQHGATAVAEDIEGKIYVTSGSGGGSQFVDVFDPMLNAWTSYDESSTAPVRRNHMGGATVGGKLYAVGGDLNGHSNNTAANIEFDPATGVWTNKTDLPVKRGSLHAFAWFDHVVVMGGQNGQSTVSAFPDVDAYSPATDTWSKLPEMAHPRHGFAGGVYKDMIFVFEGAPQQGVSSFASCDVLVPDL